MGDQLIEADVKSAKLREVVIILILGFYSFAISSQNYIDSAFVALRCYDVKVASLMTNKVKNIQIKSLFENYITYIEKGKLLPLNIEATLETTYYKRKQVVLKLLKTDYMSLEKDFSKNEIISEQYFSLLKSAKQLKDTMLISEILFKANMHVLYACRDIKSTRFFLKEYENYSRMSLVDKHWYNYILIGYKFMYLEQNFSASDIKSMEALFKKGYSNIILESCPMLKAQFHQLYGIYLSHWLKDYKKANLYNTKALEIYKTIPYWYAQKGIKGLEFNRHVNLYKNGDYEKAIPFFKKDLKRDKEPLMVMYTYEWLYKCYEELHESDSALFYLKRMHEVKAQLDQKAHAREILKIEATYNYEDKVKALEQTSKQVATLESRLFTMLPIFGVVSLLFIVSFYLYKRYKKKSAALEEEQSETLQKIDELKSIVIKNHIILKDKTKVYISDLVYIKSEDHYLNVYTSNGKSHLVRGKLSAIKEELPPNFIRCHRSFIVNANFVKQVHPTKLELIDKSQIPLSRSYKDKF